MTHFNHDWTDDTVAVPQSVGDRFYAQDLNDDFNYLKHLPYEAILQGRTKGVMIPPTDTWDTDSHSLTLSGGFGVVALNTPVLDTNENFTIPPKTTLDPRYERIAFSNVTLILPNDGNAHYIVATSTKQSLLQRGKALLSENYACRIRYDGVITVQDTAPTTNQILIGLCYDNEYLLCKDFVLNQIVDTIKLHKWYSKNKITNSLVSLLQSYYNTDISNIETHVSIGTVSGNGIDNGTFNNCTISIGTVSGSGIGISGGTFTNCIISIDTISGDRGIYRGTFNNCTISIGTVSGSGSGIDGGTFNNCIISIGTVSGKFGISGGTFNNCVITINTVSSGNGVYGGTFNNCIITINTVSSGNGVYGGTFNNCIITINTVSSGNGVHNRSGVKLYLTHIKCTAITSLSNTGGKLNVLNDTVLHAS